MANTEKVDGAYIAAMRAADSFHQAYESMWKLWSRDIKFKDDEDRENQRKKFMDDITGSLQLGRKRSNVISSMNWSTVRSSLAQIKEMPSASLEQIRAYQYLQQSGTINKMLDALSINPLELKKQQTGKEIMNGVLAFVETLNFTPTKEFAVFGDLNEEREAFSNIFDKASKFIEYDLEGIADHITQYAFGTVDFATNNLGATLKTDKNAMVSGVIGLDKDIQTQILGQIAKYRKLSEMRSGWKGFDNKKYLYAVDEMVKFGLGDWTFDKKTGLAKLTKYGSDADVEAVRKDRARYFDLAEKGAIELGKLWNDQTKNLVNYNFNGKTFQVYAFEKEILSQVERGLKSGNGLTMVSTNAMGYDNRQIEAAFGFGGWGSRGGQALFAEMSGNTGSLQQSTYQLDMTSIGRALKSPNLVLSHGMEAAIAQSMGDSFNSSTGNTLVYSGGKTGLAKINAAVDEIVGAGVKHAAEADVYVQGETHVDMITKFRELAKKFVERQNQKIEASNATLNSNSDIIPLKDDESIFAFAGSHHKAQKGSEFFITNGQFKDMYGSFLIDETSGETRFAGHTRIDANGVVRPDIVSHGSKKGTLAVLLSDVTRFQFDPNDTEAMKAFEAFQQTGAVLPGTNLYAYRFGIVGDDGKTRKTYVRIGTKEQLRNTLQNQRYAGDFSREMYIGQEQARIIEERKAAAQAEYIKAIENNVKAIHQAYDAGLVSKQVVDAVDRFDYDTLTVDVGLTKEREAHRKAYEAERAKILKEIGLTEGELPDYKAAFAEDTDELWKQYKNAKRAAWDAKQDKKAARKKWQESPEQKAVDEAFAKRNELRGQRDALRSQRDALKQQIYEALKKTARTKTQKTKRTVLFDQLREVQASLLQVSQALRKASINAHNVHEKYKDIDADYRKAAEKYQESLTGLRLVEDKRAGIHWVANQAYKAHLAKLKPLLDLEQREAQWQHDFLARTEKGRIVYKAPDTPDIAANDPTKTFTEKDWERIMTSVEGQTAVDHTVMDGREIHGLATPHLHGDKVRYEIDNVDLAKRSAQVIKNETAGNWLRDMNIKKARNIVALTRASNEFATKFFGFNSAVLDAQQMSQVTDYVLDAYRYGSQASFYSGLSNPQRQAYDTLVRKINSVMRGNSKPEFDRYPNFIQNFTNSFGWARQMESILSVTTRAAGRSAGGNNIDAQNFAFRQIYPGVLAALQQEANTDIAVNNADIRQWNEAHIGQPGYQVKTGYHVLFDADDALGRSIAGLKMTQEEMNSFDVDLTGILSGGKMGSMTTAESKIRHIFNVKLDVGESFGARLASNLGLDKEKPQDIMRALHLLGTAIVGTYGNGTSDEDVKLGKALNELKHPDRMPYSQEYVQNLIVQKLKRIRETNPLAGAPEAIRLMMTDQAPLPVQYMQGKSGSEKEFINHVVDLTNDITSSPSFTKFDEERQKPKDLAKIIAKRLFEGTADVDIQKLQAAGYSAEEAQRILDRRGRRFEDTKKFLEVFFNSTYGRNSHIGYEYSEKGQFHFSLLDGSGDILDVTHLLPFDEFNEKTGQFSTRISGRHIATVQEFAKGVGEEADTYSYRSLINAYTRALIESSKKFNSPHRSDKKNLNNYDVFTREALDKIVNRSFTKFDEQDIRYSNYFDLMPFFKRLGFFAANGGFMDKSGNINDLSQEMRELLWDMQERYKKNQRDATGALLEEVKVSNTDLSTIMSDLPRLLMPLRDSNSKLSQLVFGTSHEAWNSFQEILGHIRTTGLRHPGNGLVSLTDTGMPFMSSMSNDGRHMANVFQRAHNLQDVDKFFENIDNVEKYRSTIGKRSSLGIAEMTRFDSVVLTAEEANRRRAGSAATKVFRTVELSMTQSRLEQILAQPEAQKVMQDLGVSASQFYTYISESGGMMNPLYLDQFEKNIVQKQTTSNELDIQKLQIRRGNEALDQQIRINNATMWSVDKDFNVHYSDKDILIGQNETFAWLEDFNGNPQAVKATRAGFLTRRFYGSDGREVSDKEVSKVLSKYKDQLSATSQKNLNNTITEILSHEGYTEKYAIESIDALPYRKTGINTEKTYQKFLMPLLGQMRDSLVPEQIDGGDLSDTERKDILKKLRMSLPTFLSSSALRTEDRLRQVVAHAGLSFIGVGNKPLEDFIMGLKSDMADFWGAFERTLVAGGGLEKGMHVGTVTGAEIESVKGSHAELMKTSGKINEAVEFLARAKAKAAGIAAPTEAHYQAASRQIAQEFHDAKIFTDFDGNSVVKTNTVGTLGINGHGGESFEIGTVQDFDREGFTNIMAKYHPDFAREKSGNKFGFENSKDGVQISVNNEGIGHAIVEGQDIGMVYHYGNRFDEQGNPLDKSQWVVDEKVGIAEVRAIDDADQGRMNQGGEGGIKISRRALIAAEEDTYDLVGLEKTMRAMERFEKSQLSKNPNSTFDAVEQFNKEYEGVASVRRNAEGHLEISSTGRTITNEKGEVVRQVQLRDMKVNEPIIQNLKEEVIAGTRPNLQFKGGANDVRLYEELDNIGIAKGKAKAIVEGYNAKGFDVVGMDTVKNQYAYVSGQASIAFNRDIAKASTEAEKQEIIQRYMDSGLFGNNVIDISELSLDKSVGSTTDVNNLMERGGIIRVGDDYVAIGFQPAKAMNNEDGVGAKSSSDLRTAVSEMKQRYDFLVSQGYNEKTRKRIEALDSQLSDAVENVREMTIASVGSKGGAIEDVTTGYLPNSGMFKGGILRTENGLTLDETDIKWKDDWLKEEERLKSRVSSNQLLKDYSIDGVSLADHIAAGRRVNAVFVGKDYFENIVKNGGEFRQALAAIKGYKSVEEITENDEEEALEQVLNAAKTGSIGIGMRQPMEYEGSVQGMRIFYNEHIASNEMVMTETAAAAMKLDKDGDIAYLNVLREQANIVVNGTAADKKKSLDMMRLSGIDASALRAVAKQSGIDVDIEFRDPSVFDRAAGSADMAANATQSNRHRADYNLKNGRDANMDEATEGMPHIKEVEIGGHNYSVAGLTDTQRTNIQRDYEDIVKSDSFQQFYQQYASDNNVNDKIVQNVMKAGKNSATDLVESGAANAYLATLQGDDMLKARKAIGYTAAAEANATEMAKEVLRGDTGLNNTDTFRFKDVVNRLQDEGLTNYEAGDQHIVSHLLEHWNDAYQATKNSTATGMFTQQEASRAMRDFFGVNSKHYRNTQSLIDLVQFMYDNGGIKELASVPRQEGVEVDNKGMISFERLKQAIEHILPENRSLNKDWYDEFRVGFAMSPKAPQLAESKNSSDLKGVADSIANELLPEQAKLKTNVPLTVEANTTYTRRSFGLDEEPITNAIKEEMEGDIGDVITSSFRTAGSVLQHGGAKAMLGFAGAMMMAGMAGGAPTSPTPAQGQAKGIQSENAMYSIPSTSPTAGKSQPQSYIINVNASTSRGRDFATTAINQAFASMRGVPAGNQMTMNIKDSSNNIGFGDIANYVSGML